MAESVVGESSDNAAQRVMEQIENDIETGDIYNRLTQNGTTAVSGLGGNIYKEGGQPEFLLKRKLPIPEELKLQIKNMRSQFSMGLFTEISRAWVIVDHDIFMWNYETNDDLAYFDAVQNTVLKIALVKVKPGIFSAPVNYGLIVGTIADLTLYPMIVQSDVSIDPTHYFKVALEHNTVNDIISTESGRVFFSADDKLYEFVYENQKGWFRDGKRCRIVNQSASILSTLIPFFGTSAEDIEQLSVDNSRHILYCLGRNGSIQVFDLGFDGQQCTRACALLSGQISAQANLLTQYGHEENNFSSIVSISALESYQSNQLNLVAVTSKGVRIYFSVLERKVGFYGRNDQGVYHKNLTQEEARVQKLRVAHIRFAPGVVPSSVYGQGMQGVSVAYADHSLCVMATVNRKIVWSMSDLYFPHSKFLREAKSELIVDGNVWAIAPLYKELLPYARTDKLFVPRALAHNFLRQVIIGHSRLLVCSNEGIHEFEQFTPTDALWHALEDGGPDGRATADLLREFGQTELLFLALRLLCSDVPKDERVKDKAAALFYTLKDLPTAQGDVTHNPSWNPAEDSIADWANRMRSPLFASTPEHSIASPNFFSTPACKSPTGNQSMVGGVPHALNATHRHDALYLYFSRLVSSIWTYSVCKITNKSLVTLLSKDELDWLSNELRKLCDVMEKYRLLPATEAGFRNTAVGRIRNDNSNAERQSLLVLRKLVTLSAETLSLWSIANSFDLHAVSAGMNTETLQLLANRRFYQLANESDHLNADLIRALIKYFLGDEAGTRELSDRLRKDCPTLYSADDACVTNAMEQLGAATSILPGPQRRQLIENACQMLSSSILKVDLPSISQTLIPLNGYEQLVDLCLLRAKKEDPRQLALVAFNKGSCTDDVEMNLVLEKRMKAYKVFTDVLTELENCISSNSPMSNEQSLNRDLMITRIISSDDELAHASLFRWMIEKNKSNLILQVRFFISFRVRKG
ncbi:unnamed protein product [Auanema sp. JU1783]|nr:unnamed protein product [Auanema sp. JU1783]